MDSGFIDIPRFHKFMSVVYHNIVKKTTQILHKTPARIYVIFAGLRKNNPRSSFFDLISAKAARTSSVRLLQLKSDYFSEICSPSTTTVPAKLRKADSIISLTVLPTREMPHCAAKV
ncbi:MAG: hypothetical protein ACLUNO_02825 [Oscillospiraceae bacterium]